MPLQAIDPMSAKSMRSQSKDSKQPVLGLGFNDYLSSTAAGAGNAVAYQAGYQPAAVTQAAITGVVGGSNNLTQNGSNAPYFGGGSSALTTASFPTGGYGTGGIPFGGYGGGAGAGVGFGGGSTPIGGGTGPSQDYLEKQALFQQTSDANWDLLIAQITVNDLNRDFQARSNILKSKSDTELNSVRNLKA